ncbi:MAG TPA: VWA domain-containing protein [Terriglobia bacterium]|nr:VWA domain-containing protein [Terriglobia bacterium]
MKKFHYIIMLVGVLAFLAAAQNPDTQNKPDTPKEKESAQETPATKLTPVRVELVNVLFTVFDKKNRMVVDLTKDDLHVSEDGKPQSLRFFSRESDLPLRIGILVDTSNSVRDRLHFEQEAATDFLNETLRPGKDLAFVVGFDVEPQLIQDYTDDQEKLSEAVHNLRAGGGTGLFDAVFFSSKQKMLYFPPPEPYLRRVMVIISDGLDNQSEHTREEALAMAQHAEVVIYTISTNRSGTSIKGDKVLTRLAQETGGKVFFPFSATDLAQNFQEIARELRSQYSLAYVSTNAAHDGTFRNISISAGGKDYHVRAKSGYFAPTQ